MQRFKDKSDINNKTAETANLKELAKICKEANSASNPTKILEAFLIGDCDTDKRHHENHDGCSGCNSDSETEKRICRCMYYYDKDPAVCDGCKLPYRWKNVGEIKVTEYEIPTEKVIEGVGSMDLILDDKYAAEVKAPSSGESLSRMFAETLTYTIGSKYKPAIAIFEGSEQWNRLNEHYGKDYLTELMNHVAVFVIYVEYEGELAKYRIDEFDRKMLNKNG